MEEPSSRSVSLPQSPPSDMETKCYYVGLPSTPFLVARSSVNPWEAPTGLEAYHQPKELRVVGDHMLREVWEDILSRECRVRLNHMKVEWTSMDLVRIGKVGESFAPIILWVGVTPCSLSGVNGLTVAIELRDLLREFKITDVEVEIRESVSFNLGGDKLLRPTASADPLVNVSEPFTVALGLPICPQTMPWAEGTGGFFFVRSGDNKLYLLTARHVVFPLSVAEENLRQNQKYERKTTSQPRHNVVHLGEAAYKKVLASILTTIEEKTAVVEDLRLYLDAAAGKEPPLSERDRLNAERRIDTENIEITEFKAFFDIVNKSSWAKTEHRVLGHVVFSPPIGSDVGPDMYTEDFAIIAIDDSKINRTNFMGNVIDLGTEISKIAFNKMMHPHLQNRKNFVYPSDRLLRLSGTISDNEMRNPTMLDTGGEECLMVLKRGNTTGLTIGRGNNIFSYKRDIFGKESREWAILPFDNKSNAFSAKGDSGSVVVDGHGRIGGIITGGSGNTERVDVTYVTPVSFLLKQLTTYGFKANLQPEL